MSDQTCCVNTEYHAGDHLDILHTVLLTTMPLLGQAKKQIKVSGMLSLFTKWPMLTITEDFD